MKKSLLFLIIILVILAGLSKDYVLQSKLNNYLIVDVEFLNTSKIIPDKFISLKLYKDGDVKKEIKSFYDTQRVFMIENGDYELKLNYDNKVITRKIHKTNDKEIKTSFTLLATKAMENTVSFFGIFSLIINVFLFYKFIYKRKRETNKYLYPIFFMLVIYNFLNFTKLFNFETSSILLAIAELLLFSSVGIYFFKVLNSRKKSVIVKVIFSFFGVMITTLFIYVIIFSNLTSFSYFLLYYPIIDVIVSIFASILNYSIFLVFAIIIFMKYKSTKNIILRKTLVYTLLVLFSIFIISLIFSFFPIFNYLRVDPITIMQTTMFFWLIFFESNIESFLYIHRKYKNIIFYLFKILILFQIIYMYSLYVKNTFLFTALILLDVVYLIITNSVQNNSMFDDIFMKLKGVDDLEVFQNIFESEIIKNLPVESAQF